MTGFVLLHKIGETGVPNQGLEGHCPPPNQGAKGEDRPVLLFLYIEFLPPMHSNLVLELLLAQYGFSFYVPPTTTYQSYGFAVANLVIGEDSKEGRIDEEVHYCDYWQCHK